MKDDNTFEALLHASLDRRGTPAPFSIDVAERVMARVAVLGVPPRTEMGLRQFGRWAAAAAVSGVALTAAIAWQGPSLEAVVSSLGHTLAGATDAALKLREPVGSLAGTLGRVGLALVASAQTVLRPLEPLQPLARAMLTAITAAMLGITTFIVGRDVRGRVAE